MSYLDESGLSTYDSNLKEWISSQNTKTIPSSIYPWTKTSKAGTVSCYPVGGTELKPVVDFIFTETPPASGDKGPTNPSTISGVSSVTVTLCETTGVDSTDYTIILGSTYYGGSIDLAAGEVMMTHVKNTVNGNTIYSPSVGLTESVNSYALAFYPSPARYKNQEIADRACDLLFIDGIDNSRIAFGRNSTNIQILLSKSMLNLSDGLSYNDVVPAFSAFFAEHPMSIIYRIETPQIVQLTPISITALSQQDKFTPRLNTIYSDQQAVQVGYVKSLIREEYELQQAIVSQGGNI